MAADNEKPFTFEISLSVLNHLGRNLYRSFITVLGEAISNSWDADAENVWIYIDKDNNSLVVKDDGNGMTRDDFQTKFLKIGYSKRKISNSSKSKNRPFIGRKGIGKLALLSCANKISILTRVSSDDEYSGGVIDNKGLTEAIKDDISPDEYQLGNVERDIFLKYLENHEKGTIIYFEDITDGIRNSIETLTRLIALSFRFSLIDSNFNIHLNDNQITLDHLDFLANKTQFLWKINQMQDPYISHLTRLQHPEKNIPSNLHIKGFICSALKPSNLKITTSDEKVGVDLFVNGRLRETDILKHIPSARIVENYLYGQIHYDDLDNGGIDRFTSGREGIVSDDPKFLEMLAILKDEIIKQIIEDWDIWRIEVGNEGDPDNQRIKKRDRASMNLFDSVSQGYSVPEESAQEKKVNEWVKLLKDEAKYNFSTYAECFISENLFRKYIEDKQLPLNRAARKEISRYSIIEKEKMKEANIYFRIRRSGSRLSYLSMVNMVKLVTKNRDHTENINFLRDATEYKPIRDALAHTALLTDAAKNRLNSVYENIKGKIIGILSET